MAQEPLNVAQALGLRSGQGQEGLAARQVPERLDSMAGAARPRAAAMSTNSGAEDRQAASLACSGRPWARPDLP